MKFPIFESLKPILKNIDPIKLSPKTNITRTVPGIGIKPKARKNQE